MKSLVHGRASTYNNHKCRCPECKAAWSEYISPRVHAWRNGKPYSLRTEPSLKERYREMLKYQGGTCAICKKEPNGRKFSLDHDHTTSQIRGLLCNNCNVGLGFFNDNIEALKSAIAYLESSPNSGAKVYL